MSITKISAGNKDGREIFLFTLSNQSGLSAQIYNYGGIIRSLIYNGKDVVLGRETLEDYFDNEGYLGAAIGRNSNRIRNSVFSIGENEYKVGANENETCLHGGIEGFDKKVWDYKLDDSEEPSLILTLESPHLEEGFPGNLSVCMTYTLTKKNSLKITYSATCDTDTVFNMTNHSYFNLDGHDSGMVYNQKLWIDSDFFTPNTSLCIPNGEILSVKDTPFDFTQMKKIGDDINSFFPQTKLFGGYDHNFCLNGRGFRKVATMISSDESIMMDMYTDLPGVQVYSANCLAEGNYKDGQKYGKHNAVCLETQFFPNGTEFSHFPSPILKKGEKRESVTEYMFISK